MQGDTSFLVSDIVEKMMAPVCPEGHPIPLDAPMGMCPACLFDMAQEPPQVSNRFGEYELLEEIDRGGMGVVFKAQHVRTHRVEALKRILNGELASEEEVYRFLLDAQAASNLKHTNIVTIYQVGEVDGQHFYTMEWMHGGNLATQINRFRGDLRGAAEFMEKITLAVHYSHDHGILHRDLTPANILLDEKGNPYVADFGLAKRLDHHNDRQTKSGIIAGKPEYMAPEQAQGQTPTRAVDVYSLGVILFEILTGERPFKGKNTPEILEQVVHKAPPDPRTIDNRIDADLATICWRCLEKHPENRYRSAIELARDLRKYLNREPIKPVGQLERAWRWCKRKPLMTALIVEAVFMLLIAVFAIVSGASAQEKDRREEVLRANEYAARWVAGTALFKLSGYRDAVSKAARDVPVEHLKALEDLDEKNNEIKGLTAYCDALRLRRDSFNHDRLALKDWFVMDKTGKTRARSASYNVAAYEYDVLGRNYGWRDYFRGAWNLGQIRSRSAYVSRAILSEPNQTQRYVIAAPIYDEKDEPVGVIVTTTDTGAALGTLDLIDPNDKSHIAMIVAPRDNDRKDKDKPLPKDHVILIHNSLPNGKTTMLESNAVVHKAIALAEASNPNRGLEQLLLPGPSAVTSDENFCDPVMDGSCVDAAGNTRPGRWLAGFAPIGNTGFVAIVETPRDVAAAPIQILAQRLLLWGGLPFFCGTAIVAGVVGIVRRKERKSWL